jgi:DNA invertase Pin-like site-specific DNA recombinase
MPAVPTRAAVYACGTLAGAEPQHRARALASLAERRSWTLAGTYVDERAQRPQLKTLQAAIMAGEVRAILVADDCELGAGVVGVVETLSWLAGQGVDLVALHPPLESGSADGKVMLRLAWHLAEHQADIRRQRQRSSRPKKPAGEPRCRRPA